MTFLLLVYLPILAGFGVLTPRLRRPSISIAPWMALPALVVAFLPDIPSDEHVVWHLLGSKFGIDSTTRMFLVFTALLWAIAGVYARTYMSGDAGRHRFWFYFLLTMGGNLGLVVSGDVASFYLYFALMTFAGYGLIVHEGSREAHRAGRVYIAMAVVGEAMLIAGLMLAAYGADDLAIPTVEAEIEQSPWRLLIVLLLFGGFGIKAGVIPLHLWLPLAHPVAPTPASAVLSGAMIKAGLLGWLQTFPLGETKFDAFGAVFIVIALGSAILAAIAGAFQRNPKTVLAYSSISQMGIISTGVGVVMIAPETWTQMLPAIAFYALHHGLAKGALFLGVGVVQSDIHGGQRRWLVSIVLALPALALAGAPLTSGAAAKNALKEPLGIVSGQWEQWLTWLLLVAAAGTTVLMVRFLYLTRPGATDGDPAHPFSAGLLVPWGVLVGAGALSSWLVPWYLEVDAVQPVHLALPYVWQGVWPILAGVALSWGAMRLRERGALQRLASIPAGDILEILEPLVDRLMDRVRVLILPVLERQERRAEELEQRFDVYQIISERFDRAEQVIYRFRTAGFLFVAMMLLFIMTVWMGW